MMERRANPSPILFTIVQLNVMNTAGWADTILWSPYGDEGMGYNNFVCVESAKVSFYYE